MGDGDDLEWVDRTALFRNLPYNFPAFLGLHGRPRAWAAHAPCREQHTMRAVGGDGRARSGPALVTMRKPPPPRSTRCCNQSKPTEPRQQILLERPQGTRSEQHPLFGTRAFAYLEHRMLRNSSERRRLEGRVDAALEVPCSVDLGRPPPLRFLPPGASQSRAGSFGSVPASPAKAYRAARWAVRPPTHALGAGRPASRSVDSRRSLCGATRRALADEHDGDAAKAPT